jgi:hypothetical protein
VTLTTHRKPASQPPTTIDEPHLAELTNEDIKIRVPPICAVFVIFALHKAEALNTQTRQIVTALNCHQKAFCPKRHHECVPASGNSKSSESRARGPITKSRAMTSTNQLSERSKPSRAIRIIRENIATIESNHADAKHLPTEETGIKENAATFVSSANETKSAPRQLKLILS